MASVSSTSTLASWDPMELFTLVNPDKLSITCVGYAPSCRRRCRNPIAYHDVQAAKAVMRSLVRPGIGGDDLKEKLFELAEYTLCRRNHQCQATEVADRWFSLVQRHRDDEEDRGSDTSGDEDGSDDGENSTGSGSDSNDDDDAGDHGSATRRTASDEQELRRRFEELQNLQREFDELLRNQRQRLQSRLPSSTLTNQPQQPRVNLELASGTDRRNETAHRRRNEQEALREAEQLRREEAYHAAQRERAAAREQLRRERAEQARRVEEEARRQTQREQAEREAEAKRLREEQDRKARLDFERKAKEQQSRILSWESAWARYEAAWAEMACQPTQIDTDIRSCDIWPTRNGSFLSCSEADVRTFFRCQPGDVSRRVLRRQALRWHPDRAARLFACVADESVVRELLKTVTMISQVVIGIMGVSAQ